MSTPQRKNPSGKSGAPAPHLALKQAQTLSMTPQLQQAIALLQMNNIELNEFLLKELDSNPLLQRADESDEGGSPADNTPSFSGDDFHHLNNYTPPDERNKAVPEQRAADASLNEDYERQFDDRADSYDSDASTDFSTVGKGGRDSDGDDMAWEQRMGDAEPSLYDHLEKQIQLEFASPQDRMIALALVENLDEAGYFRGNMKQIAEQFAADLEDIELVLSRCQQMEPAGLFALNLAQCLELQLRDQGLLTPAFQSLLHNLELMGQHDYRKLQQKCGVDDESFRKMLVQLKRLDPKPALTFTHDVVQTLIPDVIMRRNRNPQQPGTWIVELNQDALPKVLVNQRYAAVVQQKGNKTKSKDDTQTEYLIDKLYSAQFLIKALDQRAQSILKIAAEIVRQQESFFAYGVAYLKPLVLRDIAAAVDVHESTVSRITTQKYIETPRGVFELKYFFSSHVGGGTGAMEHTAHAVKARIKQLIDAEDPKKILSDDQLVELLKMNDIPIARRTVTKYREAMNIGSSVDRRRQKNPLR